MRHQVIRSSRRGRPLSLAFAGLALCSLALPQAGFGQPGRPTATTLAIRDVVPRVASGLGRARPGGVQMCASLRRSAPVVQVVYRSQGDFGLLSGLTAAGGRTRIALTPAELKELAEVAWAASRSADNCVEVSFDRLADETQTSRSAELTGAPTIANRMLVMDSNVQGLLLGHIKLPAELAKNASLPQDEARELLRNDVEYQNLARELPSAPSTWHMTTIEAWVARSGEAVTGVQIDPTPVVLLPDDRLIHLAGSHRATAARAFEPFIAAVRANPQGYAAVVPGMTDTLRYAQAFGLLRACLADSGCETSFFHAYEQVKEVKSPWTSAGAEQADTDSRGRAIRHSAMNMVWRDYRLSIDPSTLTGEERINLFIDQTVGDLGSLDRAKGSATSTELGPLIARLRALLTGMNLDSFEQRGWAEIGLATLGAWSSEPVEEVTRHLGAAYQRARATGDRTLLYHTLRATRALLPLLRSERLIDQLEDGSISTHSIVVHYDPSGKKTPGSRMEERAYIGYLARANRDALLAYAKEETERFSAEAAPLFSPEGRVIVPLKRAHDLLAEFEYSHVAHESDNRDYMGPYIRILAAIAAASVVAGKSDEAQDYLRLLDTARRSALDRGTAEFAQAHIDAVRAHAARGY